MDTRLIIRDRLGGAKQGRGATSYSLTGLAGVCPSNSDHRPEKLISDETQSPVPKTDTGGQVENTKVSGRTRVKELGKLDP